jgi:hypothetical protein
MAAPVNPELLRKARETSLLSRFARGGKLSAADLAEIQHLLPPVEGAVVVASVTDSKPPAGGRQQYKHTLDHYGKIFKRHPRVIKRWIAIGKAVVENAVPAPDPPPLDDLPSFIIWWEKRMSQRVPADILALAVPAAAQPTAGETTTESLDVSSLDVDNLDSLRQARRYLLAIDRKLSAAYTAGDEVAIKRWQKPFNEASDSVRKLEAAARDDAKARGEVLPRAQVFTEISTLLETLRQMRSTMGRRIKARLSDLPPDSLERIGAVVDQERESEDSVLRRASIFQSMEEVHFQLEPAS